MEMLAPLMNRHAQRSIDADYQRLIAFVEG